jgi:hypothetical protein
MTVLLRRVPDADRQLTRSPGRIVDARRVGDVLRADTHRIGTGGLRQPEMDGPSHCLGSTGQGFLGSGGSCDDSAGQQGRRGEGGGEQGKPAGPGRCAEHVGTPPDDTSYR